jgi:hypothetical protein
MPIKEKKNGGTMSANTNADDAHAARTTEALARIRAALDGLRYGEVVVKVQDGVVVQVERTERVRWKES